MKNISLAALALTVSALTYPAFAADKSDVNTRPAASASATKTVSQAVDGETSQLTKDFVKNVAIANEYEVATSKLALDRSENKQVREFATKMIKDHEKSREAFKSALPSDIDPRLASSKLDTKHEQALSKLRALDDEKFDAAYIAEQRKAHDGTVAWFDKYARKGDEKDLRDFAKSQLPTLKTHQQHARTLKAEPTTASRDTN